MNAFKRILCSLSIAAAMFLLSVCPAQALSEEAAQLRAAYDAVRALATDGLYQEMPGTGGDYTLGSLTPQALSAALAEVNFLRSLAALPPVALDEEYCLLCQYGAVLLAANGRLSHRPEQPFDMRDEYYEEGLRAASGSNLARFNWFAPDVLHQAILGFSLDDADRNRLILGHRRWLLYPSLGDVGFGLANDAEGRSYVLMYVMDAAQSPVEYDHVCWPAPGAFPVQYLTADTPWSVSLNPEAYDMTAPLPRVTLTEEHSGAVFLFDQDSPADAYGLAGGRYGDGPALVFIPALYAFSGVENGYEQNQVWHVAVEGLFSASGEALPALEYEVRMVSLTPVDPATVELTAPQEADALRVGGTIALTAEVIPHWADDLTVTFTSSDEAVATVDASGQVTARAPGEVTITASTVNGRTDSLTLIIE